MAVINLFAAVLLGFVIFALSKRYARRLFAFWREHMQESMHNRTSARHGGLAGELTNEEAYQVLGLQAGASKSDIIAAHRALIKKIHPDQGGTAYLAARVNQAKEKLLRQHR